MIADRFQVVCRQYCGLVGTAAKYFDALPLAQRHVYRGCDAYEVVIYDVMAKPQRKDTWASTGLTLAHRVRNPKHVGKLSPPLARAMAR